MDLIEIKKKGLDQKVEKLKRYIYIYIYIYIYEGLTYIYICID